MQQREKLKKRKKTKQSTEGSTKKSKKKEKRRKSLSARQANVDGAETKLRVWDNYAEGVPLRNRVLEVQETYHLLHVLKEVETKKRALSQDKDGVSALLVASILGSKEALLEMAEGKEKSSKKLLTQKLSSGLTPLLYATMRNKVETIWILLASGAATSQTSPEGNYPIHYACEHGSVNAIGMLLAKGAKVNVKGKNGRRPIHYAAKSGEVKAVKMLIEEKADLDVTDNIGNTPLHWAIKYGHPLIVRALSKSKAYLDAPNHASYTPLHLSVLYNDLESLIILLSCGAKIDVLTDTCKNVLHLAGQVGALKIIKYLEEHYPELFSTACPDHLGFTPLHLASQSGHVLCLPFLLRFLEHVDYLQLNSVTWAVINGQARVTMELMKSGTKVQTLFNEKESEEKDGSNKFVVFYLPSESPTTPDSQKKVLADPTKSIGDAFNTLCRTRKMNYSEYDLFDVFGKQQPMEIPLDKIEAREVIVRKKRAHQKSGDFEERICAKTIVSKSQLTEWRWYNFVISDDKTQLICYDDDNLMEIEELCIPFSKMKSIEEIIVNAKQSDGAYFTFSIPKLKLTLATTSETRRAVVVNQIQIFILHYLTRIIPLGLATKFKSEEPTKLKHRSKASPGRENDSIINSSTANFPTTTLANMVTSTSATKRPKFTEEEKSDNITENVLASKTDSSEIIEINESDRIRIKNRGSNRPSSRDLFPEEVMHRQFLDNQNLDHQLHVIVRQPPRNFLKEKALFGKEKFPTQLNLQIPD